MVVIFGVSSPHPQLQDVVSCSEVQGNCSCICSCSVVVVVAASVAVAVVVVVAVGVV